MNGRKTFEADPAALPPGVPFCSERCKLIDPGRWIEGAYAIPAPVGPSKSRLPARRRSRPEPDSDEP